MENFPQRYNCFLAVRGPIRMKGLFASLRATTIFLLATALSLGGVPGIGTADPQRYLADVKTLTEDRMEGRGDGSKGLTRAEHFLEARYKSLGLEPAGTKGYLQPFVVTTGARIKGKNRLNIQDAQGKMELRLNQDFVPFNFSQSGTVTAPLVFVGYGVSADEFGYDDYGGMDVKDKIAVILRYEPATFAAKTADHGLTHHSQLITKAINARNHGAKGLILLNGRLGDQEEDLLTRFGSVSGPQNVGILFAQVKNDVAGKWFESSGKSWRDVQQQINSTGKPASFAFLDTLRASLAVEIETTRATVNNVLAYLPGKTDEYIVLGAHYDHLGRGNFDSLAPSQIGQIHPGADDNASGTAGLLELARLFAPLKGQLQRGLLFSSFAGEELGLLGSAAWVKSPTKPLDKAVAMLNMRSE